MLGVFKIPRPPCCVLSWSGHSFEPDDPDYEEDVQDALARMQNYLAEMEEVCAYLVSSTEAPEGADFDYNEFWEDVKKSLEELGVYRDVAGEEDQQMKRDRAEEAGQQRLPFQESKIFESWAKIIK